MTPPPGLVLSCEHAGREIPDSLTDVFRSAGAELDSHRSWDAGALEMAEGLSVALRVPLIAATTSRLVVDLNRSATHPRVCSEWTRTLSAERRQLLLTQIHQPHWQAIEEELSSQISRFGSVIHIAVHSFTPVWKGTRRSTDVGLLYDPRREVERTLAIRWSRALREQLAGWIIHRNQPYRGRDDGLPTAMRRRFEDSEYAGFELELNQALVGDRQRAPVLLEVLRQLLQRRENSVPRTD